eukprot:TRINITY_DN2803_c0_g1_i3.p1 TRINITY_DN2803_c0_g1~~TRINITY_DN2803_c0_g1_i3.p1  ORF type:complete len:394 (-),score=130.71 TRINITY_DN2803_c0_g1_i3:125-1306(-)
MAAKTGIRQSKFRHIFGTQSQQAECYAGIKLGSASPESYFLKVSPSYFAFPYLIPGTIAIVPQSQKGALPEEELPVIHVGDALNEFAFHPFNEQLLAAGTQEPEVKLYKFPEGGLKSTISEPTSVLSGHTKRVVSVDFHPHVNHLMTSFAADNDLKLWDLEQGKEVLSCPKVHKQLLTSTSWNLDGSLLATACKDKNLRVFDPRGNSVIAEVADHQGNKSGKLTWVPEKDLLLTVGFAKNNDKEIALYDLKNMKNRLSTLRVDNSPSSPLFFYDPDTSVLFLGGKGDSTIRMYEVADPGVVYPLTEFKSTTAVSGLASLPKQTCNVLKCEVFKLLKLTTSAVIPIRFEVPRQNFDSFQEDLFPPTWDGQSTTSASEWLGGTTIKPNFVSLKPT